MDVLFTIITPTFNRQAGIIERCLASVDAQIYKKWEHIIIVDDLNMHPHVSSEMVAKYGSDKRTFVCLGKNSNDFGNTPRSFGLSAAVGTHVVFLDDDNIMFPDYLESFYKNITNYPHIDIHICKIIHMGPLPEHLGPPPKIINGKPPVVRNIDTLQVCVKSDKMKEHGWLNMGYLADGHTIQSMCKKFEYMFINSILGVHM